MKNYVFLAVTKVFNMQPSAVSYHIYNMNDESATYINIIITTYQKIRFRGLKASSNIPAYVLEKINEDNGIIFPEEDLRYWISPIEGILGRLLCDKAYFMEDSKSATAYSIRKLSASTYVFLTGMPMIAGLPSLTWRLMFAFLTRLQSLTHLHCSTMSLSSQSRTLFSSASGSPPIPPPTPSPTPSPEPPPTPPPTPVPTPPAYTSLIVVNCRLAGTRILSFSNHGPSTNIKTLLERARPVCKMLEACSNPSCALSSREG